jgi:nitrate/nitrite transporter NarK
MRENLKKHLFKTFDDFLGLAGREAYPRRTALRWIFLLLTCGGLIGPVYALEIFPPLQKPLMNEFEIDLGNFNLIYTIYDLLAIFFPFISALSVNRFGIKETMISSCLLIIIAQNLIANGVSNLNFNELLLGRGFQSIGSESLFVCKTVLISRWFQTSEVLPAFWLVLLVAKLSSGFSAYFGTTSYHRSNDITVAFNRGTILIYMSTIFTILALVFDWYGTQRERRRESKIRKESFIESHAKFKPLFVFIFLIGILLTCSITLFMYNAGDFLEEKFEIGIIEVGRYYLLIHFIKVVILFPYESINFEFSKASKTMLLSTLLLLGICVISISLSENDYRMLYYYFSLGCVGFASAIYSDVIWLWLAVSVEKGSHGRVFALFTCIQNFMTGVLSYLQGYMHDKYSDTISGYNTSLIVLIFMLAIATLICLRILYMSKQFKNDLNARSVKSLAEFKYYCQLMYEDTRRMNYLPFEEEIRRTSSMREYLIQDHNKIPEEDREETTGSERLDRSIPEIEMKYLSLA